MSYYPASSGGYPTHPTQSTQSSVQSMNGVGMGGGGGYLVQPPQTTPPFGGTFQQYLGTHQALVYQYAQAYKAWPYQQQRDFYTQMAMFVASVSNPANHLCFNQYGIPIHQHQQQHDHQLDPNDGDELRPHQQLMLQQLMEPQQQPQQQQQQLQLQQSQFDDPYVDEPQQPISFIPEPKHFDTVPIPPGFADVPYDSNSEHGDQLNSVNGDAGDDIATVPTEGNDHDRRQQDRDRDRSRDERERDYYEQAHAHERDRSNGSRQPRDRSRERDHERERRRVDNDHVSRREERSNSKPVTYATAASSSSSTSTSNANQRQVVVKPKAEVKLPPSPLPDKLPMPCHPIGWRHTGRGPPDYVRNPMNGRRPISFILFKSIDMEDITISQEQSIWATLPKNKERVNYLFDHSDVLYAFFSVNKSGAFQGYARVTNGIGRVHQDIEWVKADGKGKWDDVFSVEWVTTKHLSYNNLPKDLVNSWNDNKPIKIGFDGTEIEPQAGFRLAQCFGPSNSTSSPANTNPSSKSPTTSPPASTTSAATASSSSLSKPPPSDGQPPPRPTVTASPPPVRIVSPVVPTVPQTQAGLTPTPIEETLED